MLRTLKAAPLLALMVLPLVLAGCGKSQSKNPVAPEAQSLGQADVAVSGMESESRGGRGYARAMFVHASPDAPAVDIGVTGVAAPVFPNKSFKDFTPFTPLPAGTYNLEVRPAGSRDVVLPLPGIKLEAGKIYTVFAKGLLGGTGAQALGAQIIVNSDSRRYGGDNRGNDGDDDEENPTR